MTNLFSSVRVGDYEIANRFAMPPMTRNRASADGVPSEHAATYYAQRASAGLLIVEGTQPSFTGQGYARTPGIHTPQQIAGWKKVTDAVHVRGARIFVQIMHTGRIGHRFNRVVEGPPVAPSAVRARIKIYTDAMGMQDCSMPRALSIDEIPAVIDEYRQATINALAAGFDGAELHAMSGYLPNQFLAPNVNQRTDRYGGSVQNRIRFAVEALEAMIDGAGSGGKVGFRVSPGFTFNDIHDPNPEETYVALAKAASSVGPAYMHVMRSPEFREAKIDPVAMLRPHFEGTLIANGGYDRDGANAELAGGKADIIGFGTLLLCNPDLPERFKRNAKLNAPDPTTFYTPGPKGYVDYPALEG